MNNKRVLLFLAAGAMALLVFAFVGSPYVALNFADAQYYDGGANPGGGSDDEDDAQSAGFTEDGGVRIGNAAPAVIFLGSRGDDGAAIPLPTRSISGAPGCDLLLAPGGEIIAAPGSFETANLFGSNLDGTFLLVGNTDGTFGFWVPAACVGGPA